MPVLWCGGPQGAVREESLVLGTMGKRGQERKSYCLACLFKAPGVSPELPEEPHEMTARTRGCGHRPGFSSQEPTLYEAVHWALPALPVPRARGRVMAHWVLMLHLPPSGVGQGSTPRSPASLSVHEEGDRQVPLTLGSCEWNAWLLYNGCVIRTQIWPLEDIVKYHTVK